MAKNNGPKVNKERARQFALSFRAATGDDDAAEKLAKERARKERERMRRELASKKGK